MMVGIRQTKRIRLGHKAISEWTTNTELQHDATKSGDVDAHRHPGYDNWVDTDTYRLTVCQT